MDLIKAIRKKRASKIQRLAFTLTIVGLALALRLMLTPVTGTGAPYILFFGAVLLSSLYGGKSAGSLAILLSAPLGAYFFVFKAGYPFSNALFQAGLFTLECIVINWVAGSLLQALDVAEKAEDNARRAAKMRDDFVAIVSHDLKNPLSAIQMRSNLISEMSPEDKDFKSMVDGINKTANRMQRLIHDLLDLSKLESGRLTVRPTECAVDQLLTEAYQNEKTLADAKTIRLICDPVPADLRVNCDRERIMQVFSNLIGNAINYTAEGGTITLSCRKLDQLVQFEIKDTGPGIAQSQIPYLFDQYWQVDKKSRSGVGLGLSIAKGIIESHSQHIWVTSELGYGSTFFFTLPLIQPAETRKFASRPRLQLSRADGVVN